MKKNTKFFGIAALIFIAAIMVLFVACGGKQSGSSGKIPGLKPDDINGPAIIPEIPLFTVQFDSGEGSCCLYEPQLVYEYGKAVPPQDPVKINPGLYLNNSGDSEFLGWYNADDAEPWDFFKNPVITNLTLRAMWKDPVPVEIPEIPGINLVERIIDHAAANPDSGNFILNLNEDLVIRTQNLTENGIKLTLRGIGTERKISLADDSNILFKIGDNNGIDKKTVEFTIGENITLVGRTPNTEPLVKIDCSGIFVMLPGSKITENSINSADHAAAVELMNFGTFVMKGGEITGNQNNVDSGKSEAFGTPSAVLVPLYGSFEMQGGKISGNEGGVADVAYVVYENISNPPLPAKTFTLSGNSLIERMVFVGVEKIDITAPRSLRILSGWNPQGTIKLHLTGENGIDDNYLDKVILDSLPDVLNEEVVNRFQLTTYNIRDSNLVDPDIKLKYRIESNSGRLVKK